MYKCVPETSTRAMALCLLGTHLCIHQLQVSAHGYLFVDMYIFYICGCVHTRVSAFLCSWMGGSVCTYSVWLRVHWYYPLSDTLRLLVDSEEMCGFCLSLPVGSHTLKGTFPPRSHPPSPSHPPLHPPPP